MDNSANNQLLTGPIPARPPDPPPNDDTSMEDKKLPKQSFKEILTDKLSNLNKSYNFDHLFHSDGAKPDKNPIPLLDLEKERIYLHGGSQSL